MSNRRRRFGDPRKAGGSMAGPGGPHDRNGVVFDTTHAVLLDHCSVALVEPDDGRPASWFALQLSGRVNRTTDRTEILYLFDTDGAAALITELLALADRAGPAFAADLDRRIAALVAEGATEHRP